jgi:hypothetical protein
MNREDLPHAKTSMMGVARHSDIASPNVVRVDCVALMPQQQSRQSAGEKANHIGEGKMKE